MTNINTNNEIKSQLEKLKANKSIPIATPSKKVDTFNMALVVDGATLTKLMSASIDVKDSFLSVCRVCKAVGK